MNIREAILKKIMKDLVAENAYDFAIFDTSTHLGDLAANIPNITDHVIIPGSYGDVRHKGDKDIHRFLQSVHGDKREPEHTGDTDDSVYRPNNKIMNERAETLLTNIFGRSYFSERGYP